MDGLLELIIWLVRAGIKAYRRSQAERLGETGDSDEAVFESVDDGSATERRSRLLEAAGDLRGEVQAFARRETADDARLALASAASDLVPALDALDQRIRTTGLDDEAQIQGQLQLRARTLAALDQLASQRDSRAELLEAVDRVALSLYEPLLEFQRRRGIPLSTRRPVAFVGEGSGSLSGVLAGVSVAPIEVSARLQHDALGWPSIAREVGRDVLTSLDGFAEQVRQAADYPLPQTRFEPGYLTEAHVNGAVGAWRTELCADGIATLLLGPAYLASLVSLHSVPDQPFKVRLVGLTGGRVASEPPAELRILASVEVLEQLGFADEARELLGAWQEVHGEEIEFYFPTGDGRYAALHEDYFVQPAVGLMRALCRHQSSALSGLHLVDVPGFHYSLARHQEARAAARAFELGQQRAGDPRTLVAGAALLGYEENARRVSTVPQLLQTLAGERRSTPSRTPRRAHGAPESLVSPWVIRDAIVLQGLLQRTGAGGAK